ncbi:MAG: hypothetical protein WC748_08195 [Legionellales bacterium]|jgi:hypothetical protein
MSEKISEIDQPTREHAMDNITRHIEHVRDMYSSSVERVIKVLLLLSSGGVVTVLAYISSTSKISGLFCLTGSLIMFLCGLVMVTFLVGYDCDVLHKHLMRFVRDHNDFINNKISFDQIEHFSSLREGGSYLPRLGLISFIFIVLGIVLGLCGYFTNVITGA